MIERRLSSIKLIHLKTNLESGLEIILIVQLMKF
nr:MAG TPA: hypothetical protein [Podoviridae sp. ctY3D12]